jgi:hypothetical protein
VVTLAPADVLAVSIEGKKEWLSNAGCENDAYAESMILLVKGFFTVNGR